MYFVHIMHSVALLLAAANASPASPPAAQVLELAAAASHTCALLADHSVKCWGSNDYGELGQGDTSSRGQAGTTMGANLKPINLGAGRKATAVFAGGSGSFLSTGGSHSCALLDDHSVKCWGANNGGQLGLGDATNRGDLPNTMGDALKPLDLGTGRTALTLALGANHTCALLDDHSVKCWGSNDYGQLGQGDTSSRGAAAGQMGDKLPAINLGTGRTAVQIAAALFNTCALLDNGAVKCFGNNDNGQLGQGDTNARGGGAGQMGDALPAIDLGPGKPVQLTVGGGTICARMDDGSVRCWGRNDSGQLGDGTPVNRGDQPNEMGPKLPSLNLQAGLPLLGVQCGSDAQCCALFVNNALKCWGLNDDGELGLEDTTARGNAPGQMGDALPFVDLGPLAVVMQVTIGDNFMCARLQGGGVKCWGNNGSGQLGLEDQKSRGGNIGDMGGGLTPVGL
jgi:alpha-tubulin suppressor-like RCC1 family protein